MNSNIDPVALGHRLAEARKAKGMSQEEAGKDFGCGRLTMISIEKGKRPLKPDELARLAQIYSRSVHELIRPSGKGGALLSIPDEFRVEAEKNGVSSGEYEQAHASCQKFLDNYNELETLNKTALRVNFPSTVPSLHQRHAESLAETVASQEWDRLGLGMLPVVDLRNLLEREVGLRSLYDDLPDCMSGIVFYNDDMGGIVVANQNQAPEQCLWTLVYCYGRLIRDRYLPAIAYSKQQGNRSVEERFAEKFVCHFLLPTAGTRRHFYSLINSTGEFQWIDLFRMAGYFHVPLSKLAERLVELRLIDKEVSARIEQKQKKVHEKISSGVTDRMSQRYVSLAVRANYNDKLSIGQLADFLRTDVVEARRIVQDMATFNDDALFMGVTKQGSPFSNIVK